MLWRERNAWAITPICPWGPICRWEQCMPRRLVAHVSAATERTASDAREASALSGLKVVEFGHVVAGPLAGWLGMAGDEVAALQGEGVI